MAIAGGVWLAVGVMLGLMAWGWLRNRPPLTITVLVSAGLMLALLFHRFLLTRVARRNIERIESYADKGCVFAFQAWRSYLVILVMIVMGSFLRHTALPREILAVLYTAMGGALGLSSLIYFARFQAIRK